jgi:hypothetical protein
MNNERDAVVVPKRRGRWWLVSGLALVLLAYVASPYLTLWRFKNVLESNDRSRMEEFVDFNSVRASLKQQIRGKLPPPDPTKKADLFSGLVERFAPAIIDQAVDAFVTPDGLAALIADPQLARRAKDKDPTVVVGGATADQRLDSSEVRYAFFTGPRSFLVDVQGTKLRFSFSRFRWILRDVELPLDDVKL